MPAGNPTQEQEPEIHPSDSGNAEASISSRSQASHTLSSIDAQRCTRLMHELIAYFTPILFTPATTPHMMCTDVCADTWMNLVIQPALDCDGVYKPLETLQKMMEIDWAKEGLCDACVQAKKVEWKGEQEVIWSKIDQWLGLLESPKTSLDT